MNERSNRDSPISVRVIGFFLAVKMKNAAFVNWTNKGFLLCISFHLGYNIFGEYVVSGTE